MPDREKPVTANPESLLDFYLRHGISPVHQNVDDLPRHFARRAGLYRHLGILPAFVRGRSVVEIGPGSGFNSIYTATLEPSRYVLVEANPRGVEDMRVLFGRFGTLCEHLEIVPTTVEAYRPDQQFDFVFCEGLLAQAGVADPVALLRSVARLVAPGGVLVITCIDAISYFSETLRRLLADLLIDVDQPIETRTRVCVDAFVPHLTTLAGMTRPADDWVVDNLINPGSTGPLLTIPDAVAALTGTFDVFGSSPRFLTDWRWYKDIDVQGRFNELAIETYWPNVHNLLDYRRISPPRAAEDNRHLYHLCQTVRSELGAFEAGLDSPDRLRRIDETLSRIAPLSAEFSPAVGAALAEVLVLMRSAGLDAARVGAATHFKSWFGRGQQYLSFSRSQT